MPGSILGHAVPRIEDPGILTGASRYVDDLPIDGALHCQFVRSPVAHGRIVSIDADDARARPGVVAVFTADDLDLEPRGGFILVHELCVRPPLARDKVCFVGDPVAVVVAETRAQAVDAAEVVIVDYEPLPVAVDMEAALAPDAPVSLEALGTNLAIGRREGDGAEVLADAEHVVRVRIENQRVAVVPMEAAAVAAEPGGSDGYRLTVYPAGQMPHRYWSEIAEEMGLDQAEVHVVVPNVGGAFGAKASATSEHYVVAACALRLGRAVKWAETRSENLVAMGHGRGQVQYIEMGFTRDGVITGLRCRMVGDAGAYGGFGGVLVGGTTRLMATGVYRVPKLSYEVAVAVTNTTPMGAFRGAGRPEAAAYLERVMDLAAVELGIDPVELRRRNFLDPADFPFTTLTGARYDSGDYDAALREAVRVAGYDDLRAEQAARRERGDRMQ